MRIVLALLFAAVAARAGAESCNSNIQGTLFTANRSYPLAAHDGRLLQCRPDVPWNAAITKVDADMASALAGQAAQFVTMAPAAALANERVLSGGLGLKVVDGGPGGNAAVSFDYNTGFGLNSNECVFSNLGGLVCEGNTADNAEIFLIFQDPVADAIVTVPSNATDTLVARSTTDTLSNKTLNASTINGLMTFADTKDIAFNTTTGTHIGTATNQKFAFYGNTPVTQQAGTTDIRLALISYGFLAPGGITPLDLNGGALTHGTDNYPDGVNMVVGTSTGTRIATTTSQKIGFWNTTPVVQPTLNTDIRTVLINTGLVASGGANPLSTNGGAINTGAGTLTVGTNGGAVSAILKGSTTQDFVSTTVGTCNNLPSTFSVTGAVDGDTCVVGVTNAAMTAGTSPQPTFSCWVTAANTVNIKLCCVSGTCDPASATYKVTIIQ